MERQFVGEKEIEIQTVRERKSGRNSEKRERQRVRENGREMFRVGFDF